MNDILQILAFKEIEGKILDVKVKNFGSRTEFFLKFEKNSGQIVELLLSDLAIHLLAGNLSKLKGKKAKIKPTSDQAGALITLLN